MPGLEVQIADLRMEMGVHVTLKNAICRSADTRGCDSVFQQDASQPRMLGSFTGVNSIQKITRQGNSTCGANVSDQRAGAGIGVLRHQHGCGEDTSTSSDSVAWKMAPATLR